LAVAFFLNLTFVVIEIAGGLWTNSLAILGDALHDFGDSVSIGLSWFLERYSRRKSSDRFTFGYARFELLGALINASVLIGSSIFLAWAAIGRLFAPPEVHPRGMMMLAVLGVLVNGAAVLRLRRGEGLSLNRKVISFHLLEDVLGWMVVLFGSGVIWLTGWHIVDPIMSLMVSAFIAFNAGKLMWETLMVLLQAAPTNLDVGALRQALEKHPAVHNIHYLRAWSLDGRFQIVSVHLVADQASNEQLLAAWRREVEVILREAGADEVTVQWEKKDEYCGAKDTQHGSDKDIH
jgi:cobalt-zinc-cadmium efflux system protein